MGMTDKSCLFCKIAQKEIPATIIYENDVVIAFDDLHPQARQHKIIIPKKHIATLNDIKTEDIDLMGNLVKAGQEIAKNLSIAEDGYRLVFNCNAQGGQTVFHVHLHLLGGRQLHWPPG